ncbi:MAG TPA: hypothetical protein PL066_00265 [bacterium]|nr:hypothetical protein [bacterium]
MFQQFRDKFKQKSFQPKAMQQGANATVKSNDAQNFKGVLNTGAAAGENLSVEKMQEQKMTDNFITGQTAGSDVGFEKVQKEAPQTAGQSVNPVSVGGKSGLALLAIIGIVIFALTQCGG